MPETREKEYVGNIVMCPHCGAQLKSMSAFCPECGEELRNVKVSENLKKLQEGLVKYKGQDAWNFVATFPIPNEREELGNFLTTIASILVTDLENGADIDKISAFTSKFEEIKNKMQVILPSSDLLLVQAKNWEVKINEKRKSYDSIVKNIKRKHPIAFILSALVAIILIIVFVVFGVRKANSKFNERTERIKETEYVEKINSIGTIKIPQENIILDGVSDYLIPISDAEIKFNAEVKELELYGYKKTFSKKSKGKLTYKTSLPSMSISFDVKCKKSIKKELEEKRKAVISNNGLKSGSYRIGNTRYSLYYYLGNEKFFNFEETLPTEENKTKKISIMMENSSSSWDSTNYNGEDFLNLIETLNKEKILNLKVSIYEYIELPDSNGDYGKLGDTYGSTYLDIYLEK